MKPIRTHLPLAVLAYALALGCGGSGTNPIPIAGGNRTAIAESIQGAATSSTSMKSGAPGRSRRELTSIALGLSLPERKGVAQPQSQFSPLSREEGDIKVGDIFGVAPDLWGKATGIEYVEANGYRSLAVYNFDTFDDAECTNLVGYQHTENRTTGPESISRVESKFTKGTYAPRDYLMYTLINSETGRVVKEFSDKGREESPGEFRSYEYYARFEMEGTGQPTTFVSRFKRDEVEYNFSGTYMPDGTLEMVWVNANGYRVTWTSKSDGTGSFKIENTNDPLCPATGTYDAEGKGIITFSDGTTADFDLYDSQFWR
ncbi:MAG: hypothetical protein ACOYON_15515 [Fimbriimonas sp.]